MSNLNVLLPFIYSREDCVCVLETFSSSGLGFLIHMQHLQGTPAIAPPCRMTLKKGSMRIKMCLPDYGVSLSSPAFTQFLRPDHSSHNFALAPPPADRLNRTLNIVSAASGHQLWNIRTSRYLDSIQVTICDTLNKVILKFIFELPRIKKRPVKKQINEIFK